MNIVYRRVLFCDGFCIKRYTLRKKTWSTTALRTAFICRLFDKGLGFSLDYCGSGGWGALSDWPANKALRKKLAMPLWPFWSNMWIRFQCLSASFVGMVLIKHCWKVAEQPNDTTKRRCFYVLTMFFSILVRHANINALSVSEMTPLDSSSSNNVVISKLETLSAQSCR